MAFVQRLGSAMAAPHIQFCPSPVHGSKKGGGRWPASRGVEQITAAHYVSHVSTAQQLVACRPCHVAMMTESVLSSSEGAFASCTEGNCCSRSRRRNGGERGGMMMSDVAAVGACPGKQRFKNGHRATMPAFSAVAAHASSNGVVEAEHDDISNKSSRMAATLSEPSLAMAGAGENGNAGAASSSPENGVAAMAGSPVSSLSSMHVDVEAELRDNGEASTRRTKLICTIGPATSSAEHLDALAMGGMNVARLNMCHGTHEWHKEVIDRIKKLNEEKGLAVAVMMDTEGSEIHMGDLKESSVKVWDNDKWTFSVRQFKREDLPENTVAVNYDGFVDDIMIGDEIVVDGGMARFEVIEKNGPDVIGNCIDPGLLLPRANLTFWRNGQLVRERNSMLPTISSKDWIDIDFGIAEGVDFISVSFVKSSDLISNLKSYIKTKSPNRPIAVFSKIESIESLSNLEEIIEVSDGAMVARGDLGAQIPLEQVPAIQQRVVQVCRQLNKPVIVASQLLESMIEYPTPTRAEVSDIGEAVRQRADALMLSGESAMGKHPMKALEVLQNVSLRIEEDRRREDLEIVIPLTRLSSLPSEQRISEEVCISATQMANNLGVEAILVYTRTGQMASLLSRCRPNCPVFAFTESQTVRQRLNLYWGLIPFRLQFEDDMEKNVRRTFALLMKRGMLKEGNMVVMVSDLCAPGQKEILQSVQIRELS